jgi:hypothetical protein
MLQVRLDEYDPAYDSADELFDRAFGIAAPKDFDWSAVADLSEEDNNAMTEIDAAMEAEWMHRHQFEQADVEDEGKAFFAFEVDRTIGFISFRFPVHLHIVQAVRRQLIGRFSHAP